MTNTTLMPLVAGETWRCCCAFGYGLYDSDLPCFCGQNVQALDAVFDCSTCDYHDLRATPSIANLGLEHFYAAFGLRGSARALKLDFESITEEWTQGSLLTSSLDYTMASYRKLQWVGTQLQPVVVSLLLPGRRLAFACMWPLQMISHTVASNLPTEQYMRKERRRLQARHIWEELKPQWSKLKEKLYTRYVTNLGWNVLHERSNGSGKMNIRDMTIMR